MAENIYVVIGNMNLSTFLNDGTNADEVAASGKQATKIRGCAFHNCYYLTTANFPLVTYIDYQAFYSCTRLVSTNFPEVTSFGSSAFYGCTTLENVTFPKATSVGYAVFQNCTALVTADFPLATTIGQMAFNKTSALTALILRNTTKVCTLSGTNAFTSSAIASGTGYIYVPSALLSSYMTATNWSTYANQFRAIEDYPDITGG